MVSLNHGDGCAQGIWFSHHCIGDGGGQIVNSLGVDRISVIDDGPYFRIGQVFGNHHIVVVDITVNHAFSQAAVARLQGIKLFPEIAKNLPFLS